MARYTFYTTDGPDKGKTFYLEIGITLVGRRDSAASDDPPESKRLVLTDPAVSRTHARVEWDGENPPVLVHLSSTNATLLNGKIVTGLTLDDGTRLSNGNVIRMGQTGFEVREVAGTSAEWCLVERSHGGAEHMLEADKTVELDGVAFQFNGSAVQASIESGDTEAYLLRQIDNQYWTTALKESQPLVLKADDVVQTENRKMVLTGR